MLVGDVLIEIMAEMDDPPAIEEERLVTDECEENWLYYESFYYYIFETGYLDDYKEELLEIWDELGYEFDDSETKRNGGPYLRAERSDGVYVTLTVCTLPSTEGKVILTARSGCVEM